jgi:hypothetical protein
MGRLSSPIVVLIIYILMAQSYARADWRQTEVPEPLLFDLVRRIDSRKGEFEINVLAHGLSLRRQPLQLAPEIEYAFADGKALELELPIQGGQVYSYKVAYQMALPTLIPGTNGLQLIYERIKEKGNNEFTSLYLLANRFNNHFSAIHMIGGRFVFEQVHHAQFNPIINSTLFYDYSSNIDLGIEFNLQGLREHFEEFIVLPQVHILFPNDYKIQLGAGISYGDTASAMYALRLIKEFNH